MFEVLEKIKEGILDILLPKFCIGCGREGLYICKDCEVFLSEVENGVGHAMSNVGHRMSNSSQIMSVWEYEGLMEKLIYKIKFDGCYHIINELVEKAMAKIELNLPASPAGGPEDIYITYVPMYPKKEKQRGFNQSALIARKLGQLLDLVEQPLLAKVRDNLSQVGLGPKEREENVRGVFVRDPLSFPSALPASGLRRVSENPRGLALTPKNVLLVDDIYTTGATMNECMKVLRRAGVKNV